jgi:hypothetical protein
LSVGIGGRIWTLGLQSKFVAHPFLRWGRASSVPIDGGGVGGGLGGAARWRRDMEATDDSEAWVVVISEARSEEEASHGVEHECAGPIKVGATGV